MVYAIIASVILAILAIFLMIKLNQRTREKELLEKQEKRNWMLKVALEQSCRLPAVEAEELAKIEPQLERMMKGSLKDEELEEKMRALIMGLYEEKAGKVNRKTVTGKE